MWNQLLHPLAVLVLDNKFVTLGLLVGFCQVLLLHFAVSLAGGAPAFPGAGWLFLTVGLVGANLGVLPALRGGRYDADARGRLTRRYLGFGVATLLVGGAVAACWGLYGVLALGSRALAIGAPSFAGFAWIGGAAVVGVGGVVGWGFTLGQRRVDLSRVAVPVAGLDPRLDGFQIAHISDLHIGNAMDARRLAELVAKTNARGADAIVVTGDLFDADRNVLGPGARALSALRAPAGVYAILGNHDHHHVGAELVVEALARHAPAIRLLRDEIERVPAAAPLYLGGVDDPSRDWSACDVELPGVERVAASRPADGPTLLLAHRPEVFRQAVRLGFPLVLSGHTHGGQIALPRPAHRYNLAAVFYQFVEGLYREGATTLYVNRGLGVGGPAMRLNCRREIAIIELRTGL